MSKCTTQFHIGDKVRLTDTRLERIKRYEENEKYYKLATIMRIGREFIYIKFQGENYTEAGYYPNNLRLIRSSKTNQLLMRFMYD